MISKLAARFLVAAGVFNVVIWPRFAKAVVDDDRAWDGEHWHSAPTVLLVGVRAHRSATPNA